ncbi:hypothetical protein CDAR_620131 [Caerostris darwini]|uniref:Uncharacterized protein n=1 Tax=Caerostris darwini TaxID=1538125 RepID=A0AAV4PZM8_9ARAC|nr:hypothetical protein CDAR_620131 [Caerostris darwini]
MFVCLSHSQMNIFDGASTEIEHKNLLVPGGVIWTLHGCRHTRPDVEQVLKSLFVIKKGGEDFLRGNEKKEILPLKPAVECVKRSNGE